MKIKSDIYLEHCPITCNVGFTENKKHGMFSLDCKNGHSLVVDVDMEMSAGTQLFAYITSLEDINPNRIYHNQNNSRVDVNKLLRQSSTSPKEHVNFSELEKFIFCMSVMSWDDRWTYCGEYMPKPQKYVPYHDMYFDWEMVGNPLTITNFQNNEQVLPEIKHSTLYTVEIHTDKNEDGDNGDNEIIGDKRIQYIHILSIPANKKSNSSVEVILT